MKIKSIDVENVQGHAKWSGDLGPSITIFKGANGVGKSSLLHALENTVHGSASLVSIARVEEGTISEPKVTVKFDDEAGQKILTKTGEKTPVIKSQVGKTAAFETLKKPGEYLRTITEASADPGKFLLASAKDQLEMLLSALPVVWNQERADEILGEPRGLAAQ